MTRSRVHAPRNRLLKNAGLPGIYTDVPVLLGLSAARIIGYIAPFKQQL